MFKRFLLALVGSVLLVGFVPLVAQASTATFEIDIPNSGYFTEGVIKTVPTPALLHDKECKVTATAVNNESARPNTNLIVASNGDSVVLRDVEREEGAVTVVAGGILTLNGVITVAVEFGPDPAFSGGMTILLECELDDEPGPSPTPTPTPEPEPEPVNHPRASIQGPTCDEHAFYATLNNEHSDEAQVFILKLNGKTHRALEVNAGRTVGLTVHAQDGDRLQVFAGPQLAEADANISNECTEVKGSGPAKATANGGSSPRRGLPRDLATTGANTGLLIGLFLAFAIAGVLALVASRRRRMSA